MAGKGRVSQGIQEQEAIFGALYLSLADWAEMEKAYKIALAKLGA